MAVVLGACFRWTTTSLLLSMIFCFVLSGGLMFTGRCVMVDPSAGVSPFEKDIGSGISRGEGAQRPHVMPGGVVLRG